jgi:hypothetical protein
MHDRVDEFWSMSTANVSRDAASFDKDLEQSLMSRLHGAPTALSSPALPVISLAEPPPFRLNSYAMTTVDAWGRLGGRSLLRALRWLPGRAVMITAIDGVAVAKACQAGPHAVDQQGFIRVPAAIRRRLYLTAGDRLLLLACPNLDLLLAYPTHLLDTIIAAHHSRHSPGSTQ